MNLPLLTRALEADAAMARIYSQTVRHPWGWLHCNVDNPQHHDANSARLIRAAAATAPDVIDAVVSFYQGLGLTPRVQVDGLTTPPDLLARLEARGFRTESNPVRLMAWDGPAPAAPALPPGVRIEAATPANCEDLTLIQAEGFGYTADPAWIRGHLPYELASPDVQWHILRVQGEPAAGAAVFRWDGLAKVEGVATRPAFRGQGLATALMAHIQSRVGLPLILWVLEENAQRIYTRAGFRLEAEMTSASAWLEP